MAVPTGFYPFWFWNDKLDKEEIKWQIKEMAEKGIKGFYIHSRQGLKQPYMSERFLEMVDLAVEEAEKYGLIANLYDEYPYPSGIAGGEVILGKPEYYATELIQESKVVSGGETRIEYPAGAVISALAYPYQNGEVNWEKPIDLKNNIGPVLIEDSYIETGLTNYNQKRYFGSDPRPVLETKLPSGKHKVFVSLQREVNKYKYWDKYIDVLNEDVIDRFIEFTHEKYAERYKDKFGDKIYSIFTDEIHPTWSDKIVERFNLEYDYDLRDYMPALADQNHPEHQQVIFDLHQLKYKMFCESYEEKISSWCQQHKILYAGEKPSLRLDQLKYMDIPGCDAGHKKIGSRESAFEGTIRANPRATASAAYFYEKEHSLCECYHSLGWSGTLQDAKYNAEEILALGIDFLVPHGFFYSTHGLKKHDAPPSFFFQMPFWPLFGALSKRIDAVQSELNDAHLDADLLVVDPASGVPTAEGLEKYEECLSSLMASSIDYLVVDTDILEKAEIKSDTIKIKEIEVDKIIVPPMQKIEADLEQVLTEFEKAGIKIFYLEEDKGFSISEIAGDFKTHLSISSKGKEIEELMLSRRVKDGQKLWFVVNSSDQKFEAKIESKDQKKLIEEELDNDYTLLKEDKAGVYSREIYPFESFIIKEDADPDQKTDSFTELEVKIDHNSKLHTKNKNLLRMHNWQLSLLDKENNCIQSAEVEAVPLSNQLNKSALAFSPDFREYFGHRPEIDFPELLLSYKYNFQNSYQGDVELLIEPETIKGDCIIKVNDSQEINLSDFTETDSHVRGSKSVKISNYLKEEKNEIEVRVKVDQPSQGLINPIYLAGDFGVELPEKKLINQPEIGSFEDYINNKLPYYAGIIEYENEFFIEELPEAEKVLLKIDYQAPFHEAAEVAINNSDYQDLLWEPRCLLVNKQDLKKGKNIIKNRVYTSLIRSFEGKEFDYGEHKYKKITELIAESN